MHVYMHVRTCMYARLCKYVIDAALRAPLELLDMTMTMTMMMMNRRISITLSVILAQPVVAANAYCMQERR